MDNETTQDLADSPATERPGRRCVHCGADADAAWEFCGSCGCHLDHPAESVAPAPVVPTSGSRRPSRSAWVLSSLAALLVLALATGAGFVYQQQRDDLEDTRAQLATTRSELEKTSAELSRTEESLSESQDELSATTADLRSAKARLRGARQELAGLHGSLDSAQDRLDLQANQIETLKTCLDGVTRAMSHAAYDEYGAAIAALDAVEVSCNRAFELF